MGLLTPPNLSNHGDEASCDEEGGGRRGCCPHEEGDEASCDEGDEGHEGHEGDEGHEGHEGHEEEVRRRSPSCYAGSCGMRGFHLPMQVPRTRCTYGTRFRTGLFGLAGLIPRDDLTSYFNFCSGIICKLRPLIL